MFPTWFSTLYIKLAEKRRNRRKERREGGGKNRRREGGRGREGEEENKKFQNCRDIFMALTSPPPKIKSYDILIGKQ